MAICVSCDEQGTHEIIANSFYLSGTWYCCNCHGQCSCEDEIQIMEGSIWKKSKDEIRKIQELRRSSAASPLRDLKKYSRKVKNAKVDPIQDL